MSASVVAGALLLVPNRVCSDLSFITGYVEFDVVITLMIFGSQGSGKRALLRRWTEPDGVRDLDGNPPTAVSWPVPWLICRV